MRITLNPGQRAVTDDAGDTTLVPVALFAFADDREDGDVEVLFSGSWTEAEATAIANDLTTRLAEVFP